MITIGVALLIIVGVGAFFTYRELEEERKRRKEAEQANVRLIMDGLKMYFRKLYYLKTPLNKLRQLLPFQQIL